MPCEVVQQPELCRRSGNQVTPDHDGHGAGIGVGYYGCAGRENLDCVAGRLEMVANQPGDIGVVFDYEDAWLHRTIVPSTLYRISSTEKRLKPPRTLSGTKERRLSGGLSLPAL